MMKFAGFVFISTIQWSLLISNSSSVQKMVDNRAILLIRQS